MIEEKQNETTIHQSPEMMKAINKLADINQLTDEQVWLSMWSSVANSFGCNKPDVATSWADKGLIQFRARFRNQP